MLKIKKISQEYIKNFYYFVFSKVSLTIGNQIYLFAVSYFILYSTQSAFYLAINLVIASLTAVISAPVVGYVADKYSKKHIIFYAELLSGILLLIFYLIFITWDINIFLIYLITLFKTFLQNFSNTTFSAAMTEIFDEENLQGVLGYFNSINSFSVILGPMLGGILFGLVDIVNVVLIFSLLSFISLIFISKINFKANYNEENYSDSSKEDTVYSKIKNDLSEGFQFIIDEKIFKRILIILAVINFCGVTISILPEKMMINELNYTPFEMGMQNAIMAIGTLIAGIIIAQSKIFKNPLKLTKFSILTLSIALLLFVLPVYLNLTFIFNFIYLGLIGIIITFSLQYFNIPLNYFLQTTIPQHLKGKFFSLLTIFYISVVPVATVLYALLYDLKLYFYTSLFTTLVMIIIVFTQLNSRFIKKTVDLYNINKEN